MFAPSTHGVFISVCGDLIHTLSDLYCPFVVVFVPFLVEAWNSMFFAKSRTTIICYSAPDAVAESVEHMLLVLKVGSSNPIQVKPTTCYLALGSNRMGQGLVGSVSE